MRKNPFGIIPFLVKDNRATFRHLACKMLVVVFPSVHEEQDIDVVIIAEEDEIAEMSGYDEDSERGIEERWRGN